MKEHWMIARDVAGKVVDTDYWPEGREDELEEAAASHRAQGQTVEVFVIEAADRIAFLERLRNG